MVLPWGFSPVLLLQSSPDTSEHPGPGGTWFVGGCWEHRIRTDAYLLSGWLNHQDFVGGCYYRVSLWSPGCIWICCIVFLPQFCSIEVTGLSHNVWPTKMFLITLFPWTGVCNCQKCCRNQLISGCFFSMTTVLSYREGNEVLSEVVWWLRGENRPCWRKCPSPEEPSLLAQESSGDKTDVWAQLFLRKVSPKISIRHL